jgi:hypothetical protein
MEPQLQPTLSRRGQAWRTGRGRAPPCLAPHRESPRPRPRGRCTGREAAASLISHLTRDRAGDDHAPDAGLVFGGGGQHVARAQQGRVDQGPLGVVRADEEGAGHVVEQLGASHGLQAGRGGGARGAVRARPAGVWGWAAGAHRCARPAAAIVPGCRCTCASTEPLGAAGTVGHARERVQQQSPAQEPTSSKDPSSSRSAVKSSRVPGRCWTACCRLRALGESTADLRVPRTWQPRASSCLTSSWPTKPVTPVTATTTAAISDDEAMWTTWGLLRARALTTPTVLTVA